MADKIISRKAARAQGLKFFYTGKPCKHGHTAPRYVSNPVCVECAIGHSRTQRADPGYNENNRSRYAANPEKFRATANKSSAKNREAIRKRKRAHHAANPQHRSEYNRTYRTKPEVKTRENNRRRKRYNANPEKKREQNRKTYATYAEQYTARMRTRYATDPEAPIKAKVKKTRRRAAMQNPTWADQVEIARIYRECPKDNHVDHIVPLKGLTLEGWPISGLHVPWNLQYLPATKNLNKHRRMTPADMAICLASCGVLIPPTPTCARAPARDAAADGQASLQLEIPADALRSDRPLPSASRSRGSGSKRRKAASATAAQARLVA